MRNTVFPYRKRNYPSEEDMETLSTKSIIFFAGILATCLTSKPNLNPVILGKDFHLINPNSLNILTSKRMNNFTCDDWRSPFSKPFWTDLKTIPWHTFSRQFLELFEDERVYERLLEV